MPLPYSPFRHRFLAIDEGRSRLLHVDEHDPLNDWDVEIRHPQPRDMQLIGNGRVMIGHHCGWSEFDISTGCQREEMNVYEGVTAVRRQPDGRTLLAGTGIGGEPGVMVVELDPENRELCRTRYPGDYVRLIRQTAQGTFLMSCNDRIREADSAGNYLSDFAMEGFYHAWKSLRLPSGNLLVSAGYGAFMAELESSGKLVRKFGGRDQVPEVNPYFYAMFQLLSCGNVVVANWQGHGDGLGNSGIQLLEFDPSGSIVWQWSEATRISSLQGLLVLDGLDSDLLHDERNGVMAPVEL